MTLRDERRRLDELQRAVRRKVGAFGRLSDEQRDWLAAFRQQQPPFDYAMMIDGDDIGEGLRSDVHRVLFGSVPVITANDTEATANKKWQRYMEASS
ncbi:hypothetical protein [Mesorhizobium sp. WSM2239]|uniref:Uncharacterized protein n=2 Tax=unclassified Mesorhizobium TaxID=325217 RepID=A0AAU8D3C0_9HYPH